MSKEEFFTATQSASMIGLKLSFFRKKANQLGIKPKMQGVKVLYTRKQLEDVRKSMSTKRANASKSKDSKLILYKTHNADFLLFRHLKKT